jgi:hypothetical protein
MAGMISIIIPIAHLRLEHATSALWYLLSSHLSHITSRANLCYHNLASLPQSPKISMVLTQARDLTSEPILKTNIKDKSTEITDGGLCLKFNVLIDDNGKKVDETVGKDVVVNINNLYVNKTSSSFSTSQVVSDNSTISGNTPLCSQDELTPVDTNNTTIDVSICSNSGAKRVMFNTSSFQVASKTTKKVICEKYNETKREPTSTNGNALEMKVSKTGAVVASVDVRLMGHLILVRLVAFIVAVLGSLQCSSGVLWHSASSGRLSRDESTPRSN